VADRAVHACRNLNLVVIADDSLCASCEPLVCIDGVPPRRTSTDMEISPAGYQRHELRLQ
jgi:hypothetical protein